MLGKFNEIYLQIWVYDESLHVIQVDIDENAVNLSYSKIEDLIKLVPQIRQHTAVFLIKIE